jgi:prepilin-type N-terminal cleavage/methylation domain-containing protein
MVIRMNQFPRHNAAFTLVELIIVIVILGILAAFVLPRFVNMSSAARAATVNNLKGQLESSANRVYAQAYIEGATKYSLHGIKLKDGTKIDTRYGYPVAGQRGIEATFADIKGFRHLGNGSVVLYFADNAPNRGNQCWVAYVSPYYAAGKYRMFENTHRC